MDTLSYRTISSNAASVEKAWVVVDAENQIVGRLSSHIAMILRGKHKASYTPHVDCGDNVIVINAEKIRFTGKKLVQKEYRHHSNHPGGLKSKLAKDVLKNNPQDILLHAVSKMLPRNKMRDERLKRVSFSD